MQHNTMLLRNVEIEQAELKAQARAESRARRARRDGEPHRSIFVRLRRR